MKKAKPCPLCGNDAKIAVYDDFCEVYCPLYACDYLIIAQALDVKRAIDKWNRLVDEFIEIHENAAGTLPTKLQR